MARAKRRKRTRRRTKRKKSLQWPRINVKKLFYVLFLVSILLFSLSLLGYFIFFRTVVAAELEAGIIEDILFEEPSEPGDQYFLGEQNIEDPIEEAGEETGEEMINPRCALIIDDMGYHRETGRQLLELPLNLTFSFLPFAPYTKEFEELAYMKGRTVLLHLPLEPLDSIWDPGPGALYLNDPESRQTLINKNLQRVPHAIGVNNHMGSRYTENSEAMRSLLQLVQKKGLFFIDSYTSSKSTGHATARELGMETARRSVFLDNVPSVEEICGRIRDLVDIAKRKGSSIGIAHPYPETLAALHSCGHFLVNDVQLVGVEKLVE